MFGPGLFERIGIPWLGVVSIYFATLSLGGSLFGALLPLKRWAPGAMLLGFLFVLPMYVALIFLLSLHRESTASFRGSLVDGVVVGAIVGSLLGLFIWIDERRSKRSIEDSRSEPP